jgi:hypothetical protein
VKSHTKLDSLGDYGLEDLAASGEVGTGETLTQLRNTLFDRSERRLQHSPLGGGLDRNIQGALQCLPVAPDLFEACRTRSL